MNDIAAENPTAERAGSEPGKPGNPWVLPLAALLAFSVGIVGYWRYAPPAQIQLNDPAFSLARAEQTLKMLVGDGIPHPAGSQQNRIVRERIVDYLEQLDLEVRRHETSAVSRRDAQTVIPLVNLFTLISGSDADGTVAVVAHYDSVATAPGAADDGAGVALVLELARYFSQPGNRPRQNVMLLLTDGEEMGLLGAEKFVAEHSAIRQIDVVINIEARGTSGPSLMFETGESSYWSIQQFARTSPKPMASTLFYEIYRLLPNNTDFTRFREAGLEGFNFAFIGDVKNYHTPDDNFDTLDRASFQHQAGNVFRLARHLAQVESLAIPPGRAIYFDLMGWQVFYWPQAWALPLAIACWVLLLPLIVLSLRGVERGMRAILIAALAVALTFFLAIAVGIALQYLLAQGGSFENPWPQNPVPIVLAFWILPIGLVSALIGGLFGQHLRFTLVAAVALWGCLLVVGSWFAAGASYLLLVPVWFGIIACLIGWRWPAAAALWFWLGAIGVWLPLEGVVYDALGFRMNGILIVRVGLVITALPPLLHVAGQRHALHFALLCGGLFVACLLAQELGWVLVY